MLKTGIAAGIPLKFYAFDIFENNGDDLTALPLAERKAILEELIGQREPDYSLQYSHHVVDNGQAVFDAMAAGGHEGVIAKKADARYSYERLHLSAFHIDFDGTAEAQDRNFLGTVPMLEDMEAEVKKVAEGRNEAIYASASARPTGFINMETDVRAAVQN